MNGYGEFIWKKGKKNKKEKNGLITNFFAILEKWKTKWFQKIFKGNGKKDFYFDNHKDFKDKMEERDKNF